MRGPGAECAAGAMAAVAGGGGDVASGGEWTEAGPVLGLDRLCDYLGFRPAGGHHHPFPSCPRGQPSPASKRSPGGREARLRC